MFWKATKISSNHHCRIWQIRIPAPIWNLSRLVSNILVSQIQSVAFLEHINFAVLQEKTFQKEGYFLKNAPVQIVV